MRKRSGSCENEELDYHIFELIARKNACKKKRRVVELSELVEEHTHDLIKKFALNKHLRSLKKHTKAERVCMARLRWFLMIKQKL